MLRQDITTLPSDRATRPPTSSVNLISDTVFEIDPTTRRWVQPPTDKVSVPAAFTCIADVHDDHDCAVLLAHSERITAPGLPEQGPNLVSGVVTMDEAMLTTKLTLHSEVSSMRRLHCRFLLETGSRALLSTVL